MNTEIVFSSRQTVAIQVKKTGEIIVRAPFGTSVKKINEILEQHRDWIHTAEEQQKERLKNHPEKSEEETKILVQRAKKELPPKIEKYSKIMGVAPTGFSVTHAKTRFGSCSGKNAISFSCFLMDYPEKAVDYVVVHELAHIKQHNHSKRFWAEVEKILPDYKQREEMLKK